MAYLKYTYLTKSHGPPYLKVLLCDSSPKMNFEAKAPSTTLIPGQVVKFTIILCNKSLSLVTSY